MAEHDRILGEVDHIQPRNRPAIARDDPRLDQFPRFGSGEWKAWRRLQNAKPFVLDAGDSVYFVDGGGWAHRVGEHEPTVHASNLLDQGKRETRGRK